MTRGAQIFLCVLLLAAGLGTLAAARVPLPPWSRVVTGLGTAAFVLMIAGVVRRTFSQTPGKRQ